MTETLVSREGKMEAAMRARERDMLASLGGNKKSTVQPSRWTFRRVLGWGLILAFLVPLFATVFGMNAANANEEAELEGTSFYELSAELMDVFSSEQDPSNRPTVTEDEGEEVSTGGSNQGWDEAIRQNPGTAGSFIGYLDISVVENPSRWALSQLSGSSDAMGYENLVIYQSGQEGEERPEAFANQGFQNYAYYGAALNGMGFDTTSTGMSMKLGGQIGGGIMFAAYHIVYLVDFIFWLFINILQALNPFRLFYYGMYAINPDLALGMTGGHGATGSMTVAGTDVEVETGALSGLVNWIGGWYQALVTLSWAAVMPIFIGVFIIGLVLFKKMDKGSALKRLLIRLMFIGFGLPLMGSMYSATLDTLSDGLGAGNRGASKVVLSTYVDFESWVEHDRLSIPDGAVIEWDPERNRVTGNTEACARNSALAINAAVHNLDIEGQSIVCGTSSDNAAAGGWAGAVDHADSSSGLLAGYNANGVNTGSTEGTFADSGDAVVVRDILGRYMSGSRVAAASFETSIKARMVAQNNAGTGGIHNGLEPDEQTRMIGWFNSITEGYDGANDPAMAENPLLSVSSNGKVGLQAFTLADGAIGFTTNNSTQECSRFQVWNSSAGPRACNMAPLAMYNYLNTGFDSTSLTVYSSSNVMSEATREIHKSVNTTGTGVMSLLYWFNSLVLMGAFIVVGITYALAMLVGGVKRGFQLVAAVPFATLGAIAGIAKVLIYSFALIIEVLVTIFVYLLVQEFLLSLPQIIEAPMAGLLGSLGTTGGVLALLMTGGALAMIIPIFSIIATLAFTIMALKLRKTIIKAADEAVTKLVEKFLDTNATPATAAGGSGLGAGIGAGIGAGAGSAAANRLMTGGGGAKSGSSNASGTNGPDGVTTGAPKGPGGGGSGGGMSSMGAGGAMGLLGSGGRDGAAGSGDGIDSNDPDDPNSPNTPMSYASDDQSFGEKVRENGLSVDGQGYGREDLNGTNGSGASAEINTPEERAKADAVAAMTRAGVPASEIREKLNSAESSLQGGTDSSREIASEPVSAAERERMDRAAASADAVRNAQAMSNERYEGSGATSTHDAEASSEAQHTAEAQREKENEQNQARGADTVTAGADRGASNIGGTNSNLSDRERMEAQAATERNNSNNAETASSESDSQARQDRDSEQSATSAREVQAGESQSRESSQNLASEQSQDRSSESAGTDREVATSQSDRDSTTSAEGQGQGISVENSSNEAKIKQDGSQEKVSQDNRADQKSFEEQNVEQDNSSEQTVDAKSVEATSANKPVDGPKGPGVASVAGAAMGGTGAGITAAKGQKTTGLHGAAAPAEKKTGARSASTPARSKPLPPSTLKKTEGTPKKTETAKAPTRNSEARKGALAGAAKGGVKGAAVGGAKGAVTGIAGGPAGIAAGAARGAAVGGVKGAALGSAVGGAKGAVKKPQAKAPSSIRSGVAPSNPGPAASSPSSRTRQGPASAPQSTAPARTQPPKGRSNRTPSQGAPAPKPVNRPQPPKSAPTPVQSPPVRPAQPPKRPRSGSTPDGEQ